MFRLLLAWIVLCACVASESQGPFQRVRSLLGRGSSGSDCEATYAPSTYAPSTYAPSTYAPTTYAPATEAPTTYAPATEAPTTYAPTTYAPTTEAPAGSDYGNSGSSSGEWSSYQVSYTKGQCLSYNGNNYIALQDHISQDDWSPNVALSLWEESSNCQDNNAPYGGSESAPTTYAPTTYTPATEAPATEAPATEAPTTEVPTAFPTEAASYSGDGTHIRHLFDESTAIAEWADGVAYAIGDDVTYQGSNYQCLQSHTSQEGWDPVSAPALWGPLTTPWSADGVSYTIGECVSYTGGFYTCIQQHTSQVAWTPDQAVSLWNQVDACPLA